MVTITADKQRELEGYLRAAGSRRGDANSNSMLTIRLTMRCTNCQKPFTYNILLTWQS